MTKPQYGWDHQKARQEALKALRPGTRCMICGKPMDTRHPELLDFHHVKPVREGGVNGPKVFTHRACNRKDNAHVGEVRKGFASKPRARFAGPGVNGDPHHQVLVRQAGLHDIATCEHDPRECGHAAIWVGCSDCHNYSQAILNHHPCRDTTEVYEWYTEDNLPAW